VTQVENVRIVHERDACIVTLHGEVEELTAPVILAEALTAVGACSDTTQEIVIDVSAVTFLDSSGIGALVTIHKTARQRGVDVSLRGVTPRIGQLLRITALDGLFGTTD
jgi:anti-sigma B factor antagonist